MTVKSLQFNRGMTWLIAALALALALAFAPQARADATSESYVQTIANEATGILNNKSLNEDGKRQALSQMIDTRLDLESIAKFTLGKYARAATDAERAEYVPLLKQYVINFYVNNLVKYQDVSFKLKGSTDLGGEKGTVVKSLLSAGADAPVEANWWVRQGTKGPTIFDVQLQNIWVGQNLRSTLVTVMDEQGGKVSAAIDELRKKVGSAASG